MELFPSFDFDGEVLNDGTDGGNRRNRPGKWRGRGGEVEDDLVDPGPPRLDSVGGKREEIAADLVVVFDPCGEYLCDGGDLGTTTAGKELASGREDERVRGRWWNGSAGRCGAGGVLVHRGGTAGRAPMVAWVSASSAAWRQCAMAPQWR